MSKYRFLVRLRSFYTTNESVVVKTLFQAVLVLFLFKRGQRESISLRNIRVLRYDYTDDDRSEPLGVTEMELDEKDVKDALAFYNHIHDMATKQPETFEASNVYKEANEILLWYDAFQYGGNDNFGDEECFYAPDFEGGE